MAYRSGENAIKNSSEDLQNGTDSDTINTNVFEGFNEASAEMAADFLLDLREATLESRKEATGPPKRVEGKASRETQSKRKPTYIPYSKVGTEHINHINNELAKLYRGVTDGIADGIAIANGNKVFVVDSGKENGRISFGVRRMRTVSDVRIRQEYIRSQNNDAISKGYVSDELSSRIGDRWISDSRRDLRRESGAELSADQGKSADQQSRVSEENADNGGLKGKASIDLSSMDADYMSAVERGDMETAQRGLLTKYKNKLSEIEANETDEI